MLKSWLIDLHRLWSNPVHLNKSLAQKQLARLSLVSVLSFTGVSWLTTATFAPQRAEAYTANVQIALNRQSSETFVTFLRRADAVARAATQRSFDRDILVTDVVVTIVGQNEGAIAPILGIKVNRRAWNSRPDVQRWATYYPNTQALLRIDDSKVEILAPPPPPTPTPTPTPQPTAPSQTGKGPIDLNIPGAPIRLIPTAPRQNAPGATNNQAPTNAPRSNQPVAPGARNNQTPTNTPRPAQAAPGPGNNQAPTNAPRPNTPAPTGE